MTDDRKTKSSLPPNRTTCTCGRFSALKTLFICGIKLHVVNLTLVCVATSLWWYKSGNKPPMGHNLRTITLQNTICRIYGSANSVTIRRQAITWTICLLLIRPLGTYLSEIWIKIHNFPFIKMHLKISCRLRNGFNFLGKMSWAWYAVKFYLLCRLFLPYSSRLLQPYCCSAGE